MWAGAGPWAGLAALIAANEYDAKKGGYRPESDEEWAKQIATGETLRTDFGERYPEKLGIKEDSRAMKMWDYGAQAPAEIANPTHLIEDGLSSLSRRLKKIF